MRQKPLLARATPTFLVAVRSIEISVHPVLHLSVVRVVRLSKHIYPQKERRLGERGSHLLLPLGVGHIRTQTHDYIRHGTITLFAALNYLEGKIISRTEAKHTHVEWLRILKQIDRETPKDLEIHMTADNYGTHKHANVRAWVQGHPRFHMHFTPTSSSWLNLVERFFADLTRDVVREGSFRSVRHLVQDIESYLADRNEHPKPYKWKVAGSDILDKIHRARIAMTTQP